MNKEWSELNKDAKILLNKKSSFKDGINKLIHCNSPTNSNLSCTIIISQYIQNVIF